MDHSEYLAESMVAGGKMSAYKNHLIRNIEVIGQRKLAVIGGGAELDLLNKTIDALRKKNVRVPETAFRICLRESDADPEKDIRFVDELKGKAGAFYALILLPYTPVETTIAAMSGVVGTSQEAAQALKALGYTDRDFCEMNDPEGSGLKGTLGASKANGSINSEAKKCAGMESSTAAQLAQYKGKMGGQRCFILGKYSAKLDELNTILNERCIACNDFCDFFAKTPQRPSYFLLTEADSYLGNGKYIEGMECFVNGNIKVFEDKFKKKPTYINHLGNGLIEGLPSFRSVLDQWETARLLTVYEMIQTALYMGFSEIYIYGFDGLFTLEYDGSGTGRFPAEGAVPGFPAKARELLEKVRAYAEGHNVRIFNMCETAGLSMFEHAAFADIDFTSSSIFGRI
ncbi:MAG: hypothetical protein ACI4XA_11305 [Oscillospiraceae bacterium]